MQLLLLEEIQRFLEEEFADIEPELVADLVLHRFPLDTAEIRRVESLLGLGDLPASFTALIQTYDFGNFSLFNTQFGGANTGSLDWLLDYNDLTRFGFEQFFLDARRLGLVLIANGDPFAFFLQLRTGAVSAMTDEQPLTAMLPAAESFSHFIQGLGTAYQALRRERIPEFRELARQEFGEAAYRFWYELTC
jgi:hypothetical protein